jgi:lipopolysaccharide export system protein LptC
MLAVTVTKTGGPGHLAVERSKAFRAAGRHSSRVAFLRRTLVLAALAGVVGLVAVAVFNPFAAAIPKVSIKGTNLDGTRVTMEQPRLAGYRKDGRPYEVNATSGVQDIRRPNLIELNSLDAKIGMADQTTVHVVSASGLYDSLREFMEFTKPVRIKSANYDIDMQSAKMDFKAGTVATDQDVKVVLSGGRILAERMNILDNGQNIVFEGQVRSTFESQDGLQDKGGAQ